MTSIILLMLLDEREVRWPTRANGWMSTESGRDWDGHSGAQRCLGVGLRLVRQTSRTPTDISDSSLGVIWPAAACWAQILWRTDDTHARTDYWMSHLMFARSIRFIICWYHRTFFMRLADSFILFAFFYDWEDEWKLKGFYYTWDFLIWFCTFVGPLAVLWRM